MSFDLPPLPFARNALAPYISEQTMDFHYGKHHAAYATKLTALTEGTEMAKKSLEEVIALTANEPSKAGIFNNAAQVWNHTFFWHSLKPSGGSAPASGALREALVKAFGSVEAFFEAFKNAAVGQFGSGWAWLVAEGDTLKIVTTANAQTPLTTAGQTPLLTCDVWEHAYYLDFQNRRPDFVQAFLDHLVNWDFASENYKRHCSGC